jgi:hypothetical protein
MTPRAAATPHHRGPVGLPRGALLAASLVLLAGCGQTSPGATGPDAAAEAGTPEGGTPDGGLPRAQLLDPTTCGNCHTEHYADWVNSMHALASDDPVFLAMNARGQRETDGGLGTFCVKCHAPMAVRDGMTTDGLNLASLPKPYHGVTCFFCHSIASVDGSSNSDVVLADDLVMRGEYQDPVPSFAHQSAYSTFQDVGSTDSASACGACHDIVVPPALDGDAGAHIERTFAEWKASAFSSNSPGDQLETCGNSGCHMVKTEPPRPIAVTTGFNTVPPPRYVHGHDFSAIDVPLPTSADAGELDGGVTESPGVQALLANAVQGDLCVTDAGRILVVFDPVNLGHDFPSGAAQDRRVWVEVVAYQGGAVVYQSGMVPFGTPAFDAGADPDLWLMRDCIFGTDGGEVNMFWQAAAYDGNELQPLATMDPSNQSFYLGQRGQDFPRAGPLPSGKPDRVTLTLWVQPVGSDVLADLVDSGDLDPAIAASMPRFPVPVGMQTMDGAPPTQLEWTPQAAADAGVLYATVDFDGTPAQCVGALPTPSAHPAIGHTKCAP